MVAGFEKPSAIQQKGIVPFTKGLDVIQQAQSGTGKTATFCAGMQLSSGGICIHYKQASTLERQGSLLTRPYLQHLTKSISHVDMIRTCPAMRCAGILNNLDYALQECQALVLAPTRELAQQIEKVMRALGDYLQVGTQQPGLAIS
jgi:translation initiation factor 4A